MDDFKARFQQDFEKANGVDLSFDTSAISDDDLAFGPYLALNKSVYP